MSQYVLVKSLRTTVYIKVFTESFISVFCHFVQVKKVVHCSVKIMNFENLLPSSIKVKLWHTLNEQCILAVV